MFIIMLLSFFKETPIFYRTLLGQVLSSAFPMAVKARLRHCTRFDPLPFTTVVPNTLSRSRGGAQNYHQTGPSV